MGISSGTYTLIAVHQRHQRKIQSSIRLLADDRGEKLIEWAKSHGMIIGNTWFEQHPLRLWTLKSPGDNTINQIDYILINSRFRNALLVAKTFPGADCGSDHVPVCGTIRLKLKKI